MKHISVIYWIDEIDNTIQRQYDMHIISQSIPSIYNFIIAFDIVDKRHNKEKRQPQITQEEKKLLAA